MGPELDEKKPETDGGPVIIKMGPVFDEKKPCGGKDPHPGRMGPRPI